MLYYDAYTTLADRRRAYEDLLKTAASRVGEMVFICYYHYYYFDDDYDNNINNNNNNNIINNSRYSDDENNNNNNNNNNNCKIIIKTGGTIYDHWVRMVSYYCILSWSPTL